MAITDQERLQLLTAEDGAFPLREHSAHGLTYKVFARDPRTLRDAFAGLSKHGDRLAIGYQDEHWTYNDLWSEMAALAHALRDRFGLGHGDRVGIAMRNYPEYVFAFGAIQLLGAIAIPFNAWLKGKELTDQIAAARPQLLFADQERIAFCKEHQLRDSISLVAVRSEATTGVTPYQDLLSSRKPAAETIAPEATVAPDDTSTILFTSGTTGNPKAAVHTHLNHSASLLNKYIRAVSLEIPDDGSPVKVGPAPHSCKLVTFPFFHIAGINTMYNSLYAGHTIVLMYKWNAAEAVRLVEAERVNEISGPPFISQTFIEAANGAGRDLSSLRTLGMGGAAAPLDVIDQLHEVFGNSVTPRTGYGMTETTSGVVAISGKDFEQRPTSVGRLLPTAEIRFFDPERNPVDPEVGGEVAFRGPQVIAGYENHADNTSFHNGWFLTGDVGRMDADGFIYLTGRVKDIVIRGGENISCAEVEGCLNAHPDVIEAVALGAPHPTLGEELVAIAHLRPGAATTAEQLRAHLSAQLAAFKVPARIALIGEHLPRTASGKIVKRELRDQLDIEWLFDPEHASA